jgi:hypothetical protein
VRTVRPSPSPGYWRRSPKWRREPLTFHPVPDEVIPVQNNHMPRFPEGTPPNCGGFYSRTGAVFSEGFESRGPNCVRVELGLPELALVFPTTDLNGNLPRTSRIAAVRPYGCGSDAAALCCGASG